MRNDFFEKIKILNQIPPRPVTGSVSSPALQHDKALRSYKTGVYQKYFDTIDYYLLKAASGPREYHFLKWHVPFNELWKHVIHSTLKSL